MNEEEQLAEDSAKVREIFGGDFKITDADRRFARRLILMRAHNRVEDRIDEWHNTDDGSSLVEFLGWTSDEYKAYVERNELPQRDV